LPVNVDLRPAAGDLRAVQLRPAGDARVGQQTLVAVAGVLCRVGLQLDAPALAASLVEEAVTVHVPWAREREAKHAVARLPPPHSIGVPMDLRGVDPDQPDGVALAPAARGTHLHRVAVDDVSDPGPDDLGALAALLALPLI